MALCSTATLTAFDGQMERRTSSGMLSSRPDRRDQDVDHVAPVAKSAVDRTAATDRLASLLEAVAQRRDRSAFVELFDYFAPRLKGFIIRRGVQASRAEDLVQEVMLTVWHRSQLYRRQHGTVSTWIFTIARNKHIDAVRREQRPEIDPNDPTLIAEPEPSGDVVLSMAETNRRLRAAMQALPPEQVDVLKKNFFEDKPHSEVAAELGLPLGTVKSRLRLALAKLRQATQDLER